MKPTLTRVVVAAGAALVTSSSAHAQVAFSDSRVQAPELAPPSRGSLAGQYAGVAFGPADVSRGGFSLPLPIVVPTERGPLPATPFPSYSPEAPLSEWGAGWATSSLQIHRFRERGDLDWSTDDLTGPWGRMVRGSDGAWYPTGFSAHVRVEQPSSDTLIAYLPDGQRWTYGGAAATESGSGGTYAWNLVRTEAPTGQRSTYAYVANASGRLFLESVEYGAVSGGDAPAKVTITTEPIATPITDYRSGRAVVLDRRVARVTALVRHATTGAFTERWRFDIGYTAEGLGPSFYLSSLRQTFASGEAAPVVTFEHESAAPLLTATLPRRAAKLDAFLGKYGPDVMQPNRSTGFDVDDDGRPDLEVALNGTALRQTDDGFVEEELPPASPSASTFCRRAPAISNPPRVLARMRIEDTDSSVVGFLKSGGATYVAICGRDGEVRLESSLAGDWEVGAKTKLVDLNRDHQPDLIRVASGGYQVLPNVSTASGYGWGAVASGALLPSVNLDASWVHDINGDGLPDIVGRVLSSLVVWFNKGNFQFESQGKTLSFITATGASFPSPNTYQSLFVDANNDGLTDVVLYKSGGAILFVNTGSLLRQYPVPAFSAFGAYRPVPLDLAGSGEAELAYATSGAGYTIALTTPATGLLKRTDDGRGNALVFEYERAPAIPGVRNRESLLHTLRVETTGHEPVTYEYSYASPKLHTRGLFLVGFDAVARREPLGTASMTFFNDDANAGLLLTSIEHDDLAPSVERVSFRTYEDAISFGIGWKRLKSQGAGWRSTDALNPVVRLEQEEVLGYDREFCPTAERSSSSNDVLLTQSQYATVAALAKNLMCIPERTVLTGTHVDATLDFRHEATRTYDARGLLTQLAIVDPGGASIVQQEVTYRDDGLVQTISSPGKGTTTFDYDPVFPLLRRVTAPDGVIMDAERDPLTDAVRKLVVDRGSLVHEQFFRFDGQERLAKSWNNLSPSASEASPNLALTYRYATATKPALMTMATLVDASTSSIARSAELATGSGDVMATLRLIPEGWRFESLTKRLRTSRQTTSFTRPVAAISDPSSLDVDSLYTSASATAGAQSSLFGTPVTATTRLHADVERLVVSSLQLNGVLTRTEVENDEFASVSSVDERQQLVQHQDPSGAKTGFVYDALGRLRGVRLADGAHHRADFDDFGRLKRITRAGVATVDYRYDASTSLLLEKEFSPPPENAHAGTPIRQVTVTHDAIGRVTRERHLDVASGETLAFDFYYDGATPSAPLDRSTRGFLTAITGEGYEKTITYRPDGSERSHRIDVKGWRTVQTDLTYLDSGAVRKQTTTVYDGAGAVLAQDSDANIVDMHGRVVATKRDGHPFASYGYDGQGRPLWATYSGPLADDEVVTLTHDPLTHARVGMNQNSTAWAAAMSRRMNARGLVDSEDISVSSASLHRAFQYTPRGYLSQSTDADASYFYEYEASGLPSRIVSTVSGTSDDRVFARTGATLTAGSHHHTFDDLGRVIERDDVQMSYGPNGQVATASRGPMTWRYLYDERGSRIAKLDASGAVRSVYLDDGTVIDESSITTPVRYDGVVVGVLETTLGAATAKKFGLVPTDLIGSALGDTDGTPRIPSPFGERATHPDVAAAIDYAAKGWDADLGVVRMGVRDYDPTLSRFTTADPLFLEQPQIALNPEARNDLNLYGYANGNPVKYTDPSGYCPVCIGVGGVVAVLGMGAAAPSDTKEAPADVVGMIASVPGPSVAAKVGEKIVEKLAERVIQRYVPPQLAGFVGKLIAAESRAGVGAGRAEAAAEAAGAAKSGVAPTLAAEELAGFSGGGVSTGEIEAINRSFGGVTTMAGHPSSAIAAAARQEGFYNKSAAMIREIAGRHMFDNGNKRTAQAVYDLLRERNGITTGVSADETRRIIHSVAVGELSDTAEIAARLRGF